MKTNGHSCDSAQIAVILRTIYSRTPAVLECVFTPSDERALLLSESAMDTRMLSNRIWYTRPNRLSSRQERICIVRHENIDMRNCIRSLRLNSGLCETDA
jgi:hypothetical protein